MTNSKKNISFDSCQFTEFTKSMSQIYLKNSIESVRNTNFSANEIKNITVDIMEKVSDKKDTELMNDVAAAVETWKKDETKVWKMSLAKFAREHRDISCVYAGRTEKGNEFVIEVDDSSSDSVLDYNEFGFELAERHDNIADFMILDQEEYEGMRDFFSMFKKIYQRG